MEAKVLKNDKGYLEVELDNLTIAELVRNQLQKDSAVEVAAWKREHPSKNPVLIIKTKEGTAKRALIECIARMQKTNDKLLEEFRKAVK